MEASWTKRSLLTGLTLAALASRCLPVAALPQDSKSAGSSVPPKEERVRQAGANFVQKRGQSRVQEFQVLTQELFRLKGMRLPKVYQYVPKFAFSPQRVQAIFGTPDQKCIAQGKAEWHYKLGGRNEATQSATLVFSSGKVTAASLAID